jgi:Flp pilus assembly protein TadG
VFGIVQYGVALNRSQALQAAAREGGRVMTMPGASTTDGNARISAALSGITFASGPTTSYSPNTTTPCDGRSGQNVTVTLTATAVVSLPLYRRTVPLTGKGTFVCE